MKFSLLLAFGISLAIPHQVMALEIPTTQEDCMKMLENLGTAVTGKSISEDIMMALQKQGTSMAMQCEKGKFAEAHTIYQKIKKTVETQ